MACAAAAAVWLAPLADSLAAPAPSFFSSKEVRSTDMKAFKKWSQALGKYSKENAAKLKVKCSSKELRICGYDDWMKFLALIKDKDKITQLKLVNAKMNRAKYVQDNQNWGRQDYWASPGEFMARFGDCEDYAIIKYLSLRKLGWSDDDMRVVAVKDLNLKVGHAVLVVYVTHPKTKKRIPLVLDNQIKKVVPAAKVRHYQPVFSINKNFWWRHLT